MFPIISRLSASTNTSTLSYHAISCLAANTIHFAMATVNNATSPIQLTHLPTSPS